VLRAAILCVAVALVAAASARGAVAIPHDRCAGSFCNGVVTYLAEPGENNVFSTRRTSTPTEMLLLDAGAVIRGCPWVEGGVRCSNYSGAVYAHLGDGDDQGIGATEFWGGSGNDRISFARRARGGPGNDVITDVWMIYDDDGATRGRDVYEGAPPIPGDVSLNSRAQLDYGSRTLPVHLDLRPGHPSEDRVSGIPKIGGSHLADLLIGDDGPNELSGGGGHDVVRGMGGDDVLTADTVDGGDGDDTLRGGFFGGRVRCGPGRDVVLSEPRARVGSDCELLQYQGDPGAPGRRLRLRLRMARASASFLSGIEACRCWRSERWTVKARGLTVSSLRPSKHSSTLRLDAAGQRLLRRSGSLPVQVDVRYVTVYEQIEHVRFRLVLRLV
jgi:hypothetical protein